MIDRIIIENFKSLRRVDLSLGPMNLFIGANASGKSNFLDALRVLQGIGNGFTINEILDGKPKSATSQVWDGIRGGSSKACFGEIDDTDGITINVHGGLEENKPPSWELSIAFSPAAGRVTREYFKNQWQTIYDSAKSSWGSVRYFTGMAGRPPDLALTQSRPALGQLAGHPYVRKQHRRLADTVATSLANTQRVDPALAYLRSYSQVHCVQRMGDHGENFAALIQTLCRDDKTKDAYLSWLRQLRPEEVDDVGVLRGAVGEPLFMLRENGREVPAPILSDGTLRFAALTAAFFQPDMPSLMTIEEIENGIHASRVRLLLELLRSQVEATKTQIMATTHSATVLDWLREEEYRTTFFCKRDEGTGESKICALADVPHFMEVVKKKPASELFSEGWLEAAL